MKEEQMDNKDISPACYWLALSRKTFLLSVPQHLHYILVAMEKCHSYRPSRSFCLTWMVYTRLFLCSQTLSLPFLPVLLYFPCFLVSVSVKINSVQDNDSYGIP